MQVETINKIPPETVESFSYRPNELSPTQKKFFEASRKTDAAVNAMTFAGPNRAKEPWKYWITIPFHTHVTLKDGQVLPLEPPIPTLALLRERRKHEIPADGPFPGAP